MIKKAIAVCGAALLLAGLPRAAGAEQTERKVVVRSQAGGVVAPVVVDQTRIEGPIRLGVKVPLEAKTVTGAPYSAEVLSESVQVLQDGNRIVNQSRSRVTRDSQGRVRREEERDGQVTSISIADPVAKVSYSLDPASRTAWKTPYRVGGGVLGGMISYYYSEAAPKVADPAAVEVRRKVEYEIQQLQEIRAKQLREMKEEELQEIKEKDLKEKQLQEIKEKDLQEKRRQERESGVVSVARPALAVARESTPPWDQKVEELAPRQIEGVQAVGKRTTRTIPAGAVGNERPIVIVSEEWQSPELQVLVLTTSSDPRVGESVYKLMNINRSEPAPSLFEVPPDYAVKESGIRRVPAER